MAVAERSWHRGYLLYALCVIGVLMFSIDGSIVAVALPTMMTDLNTGGLILTQFSWRGIFFINLPIGLAIMFLLRRRFFVDKLPEVQKPIDYPGICCSPVRLRR